MISIVIPTYNRHETLARAIDSVCNQTFRDWELLIVDDGSTDESHKIVQQFRDDRIRYIFQRHQGVSRARNTGIELARFPWITFLDSDDYWCPAKLQRQLEGLEASLHYQVIYTDEIWIRHGKWANPKKIHRKYSGWIYHHCLPRCIISPSSVLLHRQILEEDGLFDQSFSVCEDYELWLRISSRRPILFLEEPLIVKTGGHDDQLSRSIWGLDRYRVKALVKIYESGILTSQQKLWTAREIIRKAEILACGFEHHGKFEQAENYRAIIKDWEGLEENGS